MKAGLVSVEYVLEYELPCSELMIWLVVCLDSVIAATVRLEPIVILCVC